MLTFGVLFFCGFFQPLDGGTVVGGNGFAAGEHFGKFILSVWRTLGRLTLPHFYCVLVWHRTCRSLYLTLQKRKNAHRRRHFVLRQFKPKIRVALHDDRVVLLGGREFLSRGVLLKNRGIGR